MDKKLYIYSMKKYPTFEQHQLIEYKGDNPFILKQKEFIMNEFLNSLPQLSISDRLESVISSTRNAPAYIFCHPYDVSLVIQAINDKNEEFKNNGKKRFLFISIIKTPIPQGFFIPIFKSTNIPVDSQVNEYLIKNFNYEGYNLPPQHSIRIGETNEKYLQKQFKTDKEIKSVLVDKIIGETDGKFHLKYKTHYFFLYKNDPDLEHPVEKTWQSLNVDFDALTALNKNEEWVNNKYALNEHQKEGIKFLVYKKGGFIFDTTGLGKSFQAFYASIVANSKRTLILTIKYDKKKWADLVKEHGFKVNILGGTKKLNYDKDAEYDVLNYESLDRYCKKGADINLLAQRYDCIIADECHNLRNAMSRKSRRANEIFKKPYVQYKFGLSASPFENNQHFMEMCSIMEIKINSVIPLWTKGYNAYMKSLNDFKLQYCYGWKMSKNGKEFVTSGITINGRRVVNSNTHELAQQIKYSYLCRTDKDIPKFPKKTVHELKIEMSAFEQSEYERYKKQLKEQYSNKEIYGNINEDLPMFVKLREFLSKVAVPHTANFAKLKIKGGEKIIIFTHFKEEFELLCESLAGYAVWVHAEKKGRWRNKMNHEIVDEFKKSKNYNIIIGNIQTLGTAHNIPEAHHTIINSPNWNSGEHEQAMGRNWRINTPHDVHAWFWIVEDSEVRTVYERAKSKEENTKILLGII